jgi:hypothetical protein
MAEGKGAYYGSLTASTTFTGGDALSLANPEGVDLLITRFIINVTTEATGAATVDAGVAADGSTSNDELLDGVDVGSAPILKDNIEECVDGNVAAAVVEWGSDEYLTITPSASLAGLVGTYYIEYIRV